MSTDKLLADLLERVQHKQITIKKNTNSQHAY